MCSRYAVFRWLPDYMTTFNPSNRQMHEVTFVAWLEVEDYLITLSNFATWSSTLTRKPPDIRLLKPVSSRFRNLTNHAHRYA